MSERTADTDYRIALATVTLLFIATVLSGCSPACCSPAWETKNQIIYLTGEETKSLFSGNTVEALNINTGTASFTFYSDTGEARQERLWEYRQGSWRIDNKDRICLQFGSGKENCQVIGVRNGIYRKYQNKQSGALKPVVRYRQFLPGNPIKL